jgi:hypothetical protein
LLLLGDCLTVGGVSDEGPADIGVRADLPRIAGTIRRAGEDYFWQARGVSEVGELVTAERPLNVAGSARIVMRRSTPLSQTVTLQVAPPHRFTEHVDGVVLVAETVLVGPESDCHIRCPISHSRVIVTYRNSRWLGRAAEAGEFVELLPGARATLGDLAMTLESA